MKKLKINIVCSDRGWIYDQFISAFEKYSKHTILRNSKQLCEITHYIPYYEIPKPKHTPHPCTAWFSHQELKDPLKTKFISAAKTVDCVISHSKKYADLLKQHGIKSVKQVMPGVDLDKFKLRSTKRPKNDKLVVAYIGRFYSSSNRKNKSLVQKISKLPWVDFRITGGKLDFKDIPSFIGKCDIIISTGLWEGGPLGVQQGLACGIPSILFKGVGIEQEFNEGLLKISFNNSEAFVSRLKLFWENNEYIKYRNLEIMRQMRKQVKPFTLENFVHKHDIIWGDICL